MLRPSRILWAVILVPGLAVACGDYDITPKRDGGTTADARIDTGPVVDVGTTDGEAGPAGKVTLTGRCITYASLSTTSPAPGVEVSIKDNSAVAKATTNTNGEWTLKDVPDLDSLISVTKSGTYYPYLTLYGRGQDSRSYRSLLLFSPTMIGYLVGMLAGSMASGKGHIFFSATGSETGDFTGVAGTSISMSPKNGQGPYYLNANGTAGRSLTATSSAGRCFIVNVDPGDYTIAFANSSKTCTILHGWKGSTASEIRVRVVADAATVVTVLCP